MKLAGGKMLQKTWHYFNGEFEVLSTLCWKKTLRNVPYVNIQHNAALASASVYAHIFPNLALLSFEIKNHRPSSGGTFRMRFTWGDVGTTDRNMGT